MKIRNAPRLGACIAALTLGVGAARAQDFYDGVRAPGTVQLDNYMSYNGDTSGMVIPKLFTKNFLVAAPIGISEEGVDLKGVNIGYIAEDFSEKNKAIIATGIFKDGEGKFRNVSPQVYFTRMTGPWTIDLSGSANFNLDSHDVGLRGSATIGYGINDRWRVGGAAIVERGEKPKVRGILRYEIKENHGLWGQLYIDKDAIGARLAFNR